MRIPVASVPRVALASMIIGLMAVGLSATAFARDLALMPWPKTIEQTQGALPIEGSFLVVWSGFHDARLDRAARRFQADIDRRTGQPRLGPGPRLEISVAGDDPNYLTIRARESYRLSVTTAGARLEADGPA